MCYLCSQSYGNNPSPFGGPLTLLTLQEMEAGRKKRQQGVQLPTSYAQTAPEHKAHQLGDTAGQDLLPHTWPLTRLGFFARMQDEIHSMGLQGFLYL